MTKNPLIVIVDDDESVCRSLDRLVRSLGMAAKTCVSGADFVSWLQAAAPLHPDCIILDLHMPDMNGIEVQAWIRRTHRDLPVIFITAHDDRSAKEQALVGGALAFLRKPCSEGLIIRTLETALGPRK